MEFLRDCLTTSMSKSFVTYSKMSFSASSKEETKTSYKLFGGRFILNWRSTSTQFSFCLDKREKIGLSSC